VRHEWTEVRGQGSSRGTRVMECSGCGETIELPRMFSLGMDVYLGRLKISLDCDLHMVAQVMES
jgi:hypothetical protein